MRSRSFFPLYLRTLLCILLIWGVLAAGCTTFPGTHAPLLNQTASGDLQAYFLDVGQADASVILFRDKVILIDAGEPDQGEAVVAALKKLGVTRIDLLVATHPHSDHIGGMQKVFANFAVGRVLDAGIPSTSPLYERFLETIDKKGIPYLVAEQGQTIDLDDSLRILVLSPPRDRPGDDINTSSIVLRISYGTVNLLFLGDATTAAEEALVRTGYPLDAQVLKVGHHGSSGSSSAPFLARVDPDVAVITVARENDYRHPHKKTLDRLGAAGATVYRTDRDGTVLVTSDGTAYSVLTENGNGNIWARSPPSTPPPGTATLVPAASPAPAANLTANLTASISALSANVTVPVPSLTLPGLQIGNASSVYISAVRFDAPGDDRENLNGEWVRIATRGEGPVLLAGWTLTDRSNTRPYIFPALLLMPGHPVTIYTGSGMMNDTSLFMASTSPVFGNSGDEAILMDGQGNIIDRRTEGAPA